MNQSRMIHARDIFTRTRGVPLLGADFALVLILGFGEAESLVVRAVEHCWNSWKTCSVVFHSSNGFHSRF